MRNNIKSNNYYSISSYIHEMNPLVKIICSLIFTLILFLAKTIWLNLIMLVLLFINILLTNIPMKVYINIFKKIIIFIIVVFLINMLFHMNIKLNIILCIKYIEVIVYACLVSITTKPLAIVKSINIMFWPLRIIGIPIQYISFFIVYAIQFIANIFDLSKIISKSQKSKAVKGLKKLRFKTIPLFVLDSKNNKQLKNSLDIKVYDLNWQKNYSLKFKFKLYDFTILLLYIFVLLLTFFEEV